MIKWNLIVDAPERGAFNMNFDLKLAENCLPNEAFFRLYRWSPYCVSLGANQSPSEIDIESLKNENVDLVKRPTGGRAILHAEELTYSVVMPIDRSLFPKEIYRRISSALVAGLELYDEKLKKLELENEDPDFNEALTAPSGSLCFATSARSEIKYAGLKLVGSAQKKFSSSILQHGSILCGAYHKNLPRFLNADKEIKRNLEIELNNKTIELDAIVGCGIDYGRLINCMIDGFESSWKINFDERIISGYTYE